MSFTSPEGLNYLYRGRGSKATGYFNKMNPEEQEGKGQHIQQIRI